MGIAAYFEASDCSKVLWAPEMNALWVPSDEQTQELGRRGRKAGAIPTRASSDLGVQGALKRKDYFFNCVVFQEQEIHSKIFLIA